MPRRKSKGGRPTKLDDEMIATICESVANGSPAVAAAGAAGIDDATFYRWQQQGLSNPSSQYGAFARALRVARQRCHDKLAQATFGNALADGKTGLNFLGRRFSRWWAETQRIQHAGADGKNLIVEVRTLPPEPSEGES